MCSRPLASTTSTQLTMAKFIILVLTAAAAAAAASGVGGADVVSNVINNTSSVRAFPDGFLFGAATAAYQIEGYWNVSGRSPSIWDHLLHDVDPCFNDECSNGDDACKSWMLWERDVEMVKSAGLDFYRFSIAWPRILPGGFANETNQAGLDYYNKLIDKLLENNILPLITVYHWDMPQALQELGGFANPNVADWLGDYARVLFENFGDRVKHWITINEPSEICYSGYGEAWFAPLIGSSGIGDYLCGKNLLMAHANIYHIYDKEFRPTQRGTIGITLSARWYEPEAAEGEHEDGAEDFRQFRYGIWANPIFGSGGWPQRVRERVARNSAAEGFPRSRLPALSDGEAARLRGSSDFLGLNHYTTSLVYRNSSVAAQYEAPSYERDVYASAYQPDEWRQNATSWVYDLPWGFHKLLLDIKNKYNNPKVFILENGYAERIPIGQSQLNDVGRVNYHRGYLGALLDAVAEGCDVVGYTVWSLLDNFSWRRGYKTRFGLFETDMASERRTRTPRRSAYVYKHIVQTRALDLAYEPDTSVPL